MSIKVTTGCVAKALHLRGCRHTHHDVMLMIVRMQLIDQRLTARYQPLRHKGNFIRLRCLDPA